MGRGVVVAVLALAALASVYADDDPTVSLKGVHDLSDEDFDAVVNGRKHALIEFYAPWCGHCKRLTPVYKQLGEKVSGDAKLSSRVVIAKVDADKHRDLGQRFGVKGFPTILYFARGKPVEQNTPYQGARSYEGFLAFINDQLENDKGFARSDALDAFATRFVEAAEDARVAIVEEAKAAVGAITGDAKAAADLYAKYMDKATVKGHEYFQKEYERLDRIISSGAVSPSKMQEVAKKASVLSAFIPGLNTKPGAEVEQDAEVEAEEDEEAESEDLPEAEE